MSFSIVCEQTKGNAMALMVGITENKAAIKNASVKPALGLNDLARKLQRREDGALEAIIERTQKACYSLAYSVLQDSDLAKDALQDAYFLVYQRIGQLREPAAFKGWLFRIVNHCCQSIIRRRAQEVETDFEEREDLHSQHQSGDLAVEVTENQNIRDVFRQLPEIDRTALAMREVASLSYEEMSRALNIPLGTVRSRLAKARKRFIELYKGLTS